MLTNTVETSNSQINTIRLGVKASQKGRIAIWRKGLTGVVFIERKEAQKMRLIIRDLILKIDNSLGLTKEHI